MSQLLPPHMKKLLLVDALFHKWQTAARSRGLSAGFMLPGIDCIFHKYIIWRLYVNFCNAVAGLIVLIVYVLQ